MKSHTEKEKFYVNWVLQQFKSMGATQAQLNTEKWKLMFEYGYLEYSLNFLNYSEGTNEQEKHKKGT
jgi:hypothetical protein